MSHADRERVEWIQRAREERARHRVYRAELFEKIRRALYIADPIGLAANGAPADEYDPEAGTILSRLPDATSTEDVHRIVREELIRWFGSWWLTWNPDKAEARVEQGARTIWAAWVGRS